MYQKSPFLILIIVNSVAYIVIEHKRPTGDLQGCREVEQRMCSCREAHELADL